jgi:hypothetical protein
MNTSAITIICYFKRSTCYFKYIRAFANILLVAIETAISMMGSLTGVPNEIAVMIISFLSYVDRLSLTLVSHHLYDIMQMMIRSVTSRANLRTLCEHVDIYSIIRFESAKYIPTVSKWAFLSGTPIVADWLLAHNYSIVNAIKGCCRLLNIELALRYFPDYPCKIAHYFARYGHTPPLLYQSGSKYVNSVLMGAARGGHEDIVLRFIDLPERDISVSMVFRQACRSGNMKLIQTLHDKYGIYSGVDYEYGIINAFAGGHINVVEWIVHIGGSAIAWSRIIELCSIQGSKHAHVLNYLETNPVTCQYVIPWVKVLVAACRKDNVAVVVRALQHWQGPQPIHQTALTNALATCALHGAKLSELHVNAYVHGMTN